MPSGKDPVGRYLETAFHERLDVELGNLYITNLEIFSELDMLEAAYARLLLHFGLGEFKASEAREVLKSKSVRLALHRLQKAGYLVRVSREVFRAVHPVLLAMEWAGYSWREKVGRSEYLPFLEKIVVSIVEGFWEKLVSIVLFGSLASGKTRPESDIDLLVVAESLPESYSDRLKLFREIVHEIEDERIKLWREKGVYPLIDPILLTPDEALSTQPFYLDLLENSLIIYDRDEFMRRKLEELRKRLNELGSRKVTLPDGSWYWVIKPNARPGEVIEI